MYNNKDSRQQTADSRQQTADSLSLSNLSKRVISLRFLLIIFVVIIHNGINKEEFSKRNAIAIIPHYVENVQNLIGIITAVAVPLFFLFSAYFLYIKEQKYILVLKKKSRTIAMPYLLWHVLLIGFYFAISEIPLTKHLFTPEKPVLSWEFVDWVKALLGDWVKMIEMERTTSFPFIVPFWFLRDLFILNILFVGIKKLVDTFPLGTLVLFLIFWICNIRIYIVSPEALLFFTFGYYIVKYNLTIKNIDRIKILDISAIYILTIMLEFFFITGMPVLHKVNIIIGCMFFLKISEYCIENIKLYKILAWLEKYQFIVYAVHAVIMQQLFKIYIRIVPLNGVFILLGYFFMILLGIIVSLAFGIILKKLFPKIYGVLTGGRI